MKAGKPVLRVATDQRGERSNTASALKKNPLRYVAMTRLGVD
jgi:hypothetical protein